MGNKIIILSLFVILYSVPTFSQDYYWFKEEKVSIKKIEHRNYYLFFDAQQKIENLEINSKRVFNKTLNWALGNFEENELVEYVSPAVIIPSNDTLNFSNLFYVRLKDKKDVGLLERTAKENNVEILGNNEFMPLWYTLSCSKKSTGNALEMANLFYESKLFSIAEVDFLVHYKPQCVNDTHFGNQWNLRNTGQNGGTPGIDINYCNASSITTGNSNIIVAVLDQGIQRNHPDLPNIHSLSYDAQTGVSPSILYLNFFNQNHGTPCAGIIGANSNNNLGMAGIAPNCMLMDISHSLSNTPNIHQELANGINWAWQNGASIISNSWGDASALNSHLIDNAISNALTQGRSNKGTIVVFSSGNDNIDVLYPANSNPNIIVVGAVDRCGIRSGRIDVVPNSCDPWSPFSKPGSCFGQTLDIVAPGTNVPTTATISTYDMEFGGTSAAAPHIAGVAALMLSKNPTLTQKQVKEIIERTAQKVGGYSYHNNNTDRRNGTWHEQMGYGLVDAYKAVLRADCWKNIHDEIINTNRPQVQGCVIDVKNTTVTNGVTLELNATEKVVIESITIDEGAGFVIW
ncbi:MAG: S8 family serine peptidase [Bacteroidetes bacterium]|nr:S8 family serine peptidase [Bacteroidota bacterium]